MARTTVARKAKTVEAAPKTETPAPISKISRLIDLLRSPEGATIAAMMDASGWQAHSVRGVLSGALKKKLGLAVVSETTAAGRVYRIVPGETA